MSNSVRINYHGETLCCLDQTEVKAVEPYVFCKPPELNIFIRFWNWTCRFLSGKKTRIDNPTVEVGTKILFRDGTFMRIRMPFLEFIDAYC